MKKKIIWLVVSCLMVAALLLASCAPAITEKEEKLVKEEEEVVSVEEEEPAPSQPQSATEAETARQHIERGIALLDEDEYEQAILVFNKAIELYPDESAAYFYRGLSYGRSGEYDKAITDFSVTINLKPDNKRAYYNRGFIYERKEEYDRAIADYSEAIELDHAYALAYEHRAVAYKLQGMEARAIADLEKCIEVSQDQLMIERAKQVLEELQPPVPVLSAECEISKLEIHYPRALELGEEATIEITVYNHDEIEGIYYARLTLNGEQIETREIPVPQRKGSITGSAKALFYVTPDELGTYQVEVEGKTGTFWVVREVEISEAESEGLIRVIASGDGMDWVHLELESLSPQPLGIIVPPLTMFRARSSGVQDMLAINERYGLLESEGSKDSVDVEAACANMNLSVPGKSDTFQIEMPGPSEDLAKLFYEVVDYEGYSRVIQFAIWTVIHNPYRTQYTTIGTSVTDTTGPTDEEIQEIREMFEFAGIEISKYHVFR